MAQRRDRRGRFAGGVSSVSSRRARQLARPRGSTLRTARRRQSAAKYRYVSARAQVGVAKSRSRAARRAYINQRRITKTVRARTNGR